MLLDDNPNLARALAAGLVARGARVVLASEHLADTGEPDTRTLIERVRAEHGALSGLIQCATSSPHLDAGAADLSVEEWRSARDRGCIALFSLIQAAAADLKAAGGWVAAVSEASSRFAGPDAPALDRAVAHAGATGLLKALAAEWPKVCCKSIDLSDDDLSAEAMAEMVLAELGGRDHEVEIGYRDGRRLVWRAEAAPHPASDAAALERGAVLLATGGGRGITAQVVRELAARFRPTLYLVGNSPIPESVATDEAGDAADLRQALIKRLLRAGQIATPAEIERQVGQILKNREIRATLADLQQAGCTVHYRPLDLRDVGAFTSLIEAIYRDEGRIDGVIHGAGVIEDRLVETKTMESFARVMATKLDAAHVLAGHLRPEQLRFLVFFTSVAGLFGNRGQTDYAAANEILNALARHLSQSWPGVLVRAVNWGPWQSTGMASASVLEQMAARKVQLIQPEAGRAALAAELTGEAAGDVEIIFGEGPWGEAPVATPPVHAALPLIADCRAVRTGDDETLELIRDIDPALDLYLADHVLDGRLVLPAAMQIEWMAEAAAHADPERLVVAIEDFQILKGVVLQGEALPRLCITLAMPSGNGLSLRRVDATIRDLRSGRPHARAAIHLNHAYDIAGLDRDDFGTLEPFPLSVAQAYERMLFHGRRLHAIVSIDGMNDQGIVGRLRPSRPADLLARTASRSWLIDPVLVDGAFQLAILWIRSQADITPLPSRLGRLSRFAPFDGETIRCELRAHHRPGSAELVTRMRLFDQDDRLIGCIDGMEFNCSRALNRLSGSGQASTSGIKAAVAP